MTTLEEIQQAIRQLSRFQRESLAEWILNSADFGDRVAEPAVAYAECGEPLLSVEEYLKMERDSPTRHEYIAGEIFAMSSPALRHELIVANLIGALHLHLRGGPCKAFASSAKIFIRVNRSDIFYCPDVTVACRSFSEGDLDAEFFSDPRLVMEVLSPSTEAIDRREKALNYRHVESLEEYVLVAQKPVRVTIYRRGEEWKPMVLSAADAIADIRSIGLKLALGAIYAGA